MERRTSLSAEERRALSERPPRDDQGRPAPWRLAGREIVDERFTGAVVQEGLEVVDAALRGFTWAGDVVLRDCVFRDVAFERVAFVGVRFDHVTFERCSFDEARFDGCELSGCHFVAGAATLLNMRRCVVRDVELDGVAVDSWTVREGRLANCTLRDCTLDALRAANCAIDQVVVEGGALRSAELTLADVGALRIAGATIKRLRVVGGELGSLTLVDVDADDLALADVRAQALRFERCVNLVSPRALDSAVRSLTIDRCTQVIGLLLHNCEVGQLALARSRLQHTTFAAVRAAGPLRIDDCALAGLVVRDGAWAEASIAGSRIEEYLAVDRARFAALRRRDVVEGEGLRYQLDGSPVADGATLWGAIDGA